MPPSYSSGYHNDNVTIPMPLAAQTSQSPPPYSEVCAKTPYDAAIVFSSQQHDEAVKLKFIFEMCMKTTTGRQPQLCLLCTDSTSDTAQRLAVIETTPVFFIYVSNSAARVSPLLNTVICHCMDQPDKRMIPLFSSRKNCEKAPLALRVVKGLFLDRLLKGKSLRSFPTTPCMDAVLFDKYELISLQRVFHVQPLATSSLERGRSCKRSCERGRRHQHRSEE